MSLSFFQVDAFTEQPFRGNPAAVVLLDLMPRDEWLQAFAQEMNLSETAYVLPEADGWWLRWFTPTVEVDLCGHATLAASHVLFELQKAGAEEEIRFRTRSGTLRARRESDWIELDFPVAPAEPVEAPAGLLEALGVPAARWVGRNQFDYLIEVGSPEELLALRPDFGQLARIEARGAVVTCAAAASDEADFLSRFFGPAVGVDEDPVTGSAHCMLAPFWSERLGSLTLTGHQVSARSGRVRTRLVEDRVRLGGKALTMLEGTVRDLASFLPEPNTLD